MTGLSAGSGLTQASTTAGGYVRPADWPALPTPSTDGVNILSAVFPNAGNNVALKITVVGGYTVNWGDGTTDNWASGVQAEHTYNYATLATSVTSRGYKTAIIQITTQTVSPITAFDFGVKSSIFGTFNPGSQQWLDITVNTPSATSIAFSNNNQRSSCLEITTVLSCGAVSNLASVWAQSFNLQSIILPTNFGSAATSMAGMFSRCDSLGDLVFPAGFGASVLDASGMFTGSSGLKSVIFPQGFGAVMTNGSSMFSSCSGLTSVVFPSGFGPQLTDISSMFSSSPAINSVVFPAGCGALITTLYNAFAGCGNLFSVTMPTGFGAACTTIDAMFFQCESIESIVFPSGFNTAVTSMVNTFNGCIGVESIVFPVGFGSALTLITTPFASCLNLEVVTNLAAPLTFTIAGCKFSAPSLNAIYTALPTVVAQTLTASTNYGYAASTPTIATAKGWTVN